MLKGHRPSERASSSFAPGLKGAGPPLMRARITRALDANVREHISTGAVTLDEIEHVGASVAQVVPDLDRSKLLMRATSQSTPGWKHGTSSCKEDD